MKAGFFPAIGTPLNEDGTLERNSFAKHLEMMIDAGASGLLVLGSMGQQPYVLSKECYECAKLACEVNKGRLPLFVGSMDNSAARVRERLAMLEELPLDGVVLTTPYYSVFPADDVIRFFKAAAASTKHQLYLYDLAAVTKIKITFPMVLQMIKEIPNLGGIKSGDIELQRNLLMCEDVPESFQQLFSGLDIFDVAYRAGITKNLDGMFDCTPKNAKKMYAALAAGDWATGSACLDNIVSLRNLFIKYRVLPAFSAAMNALGCAGNFAVDFNAPVSDEGREAVLTEMKRIGEL